MEHNSNCHVDPVYKPVNEKDVADSALVTLKSVKIFNIGLAQTPDYQGANVISQIAYVFLRSLAHDGEHAVVYPLANIRKNTPVTKRKRILLPVFVGALGALFLTAIYFGIVSWAESPQHALDLFWQDRWIVVPIILGFGIQAALYTILKKGLFLPVASMGPSSAMTGAGGATSMLAMVACCAHHVTDVLPILGLTAAATFLANYQLAFMMVGLGTTTTGIIIMFVILFGARRTAMQHVALKTEAA